MTRWVAFATIVTLLSAAMVWLSLLTQRSITPADGESKTVDPATAAVPGSDPDQRPRSRADTADGSEIGAGHRESIDGGDASSPPDEREIPAGSVAPPPDGTGSDRIVGRARGIPITSRDLLVNVLATQGLCLAVVVTAIGLTGVPVDALGIERSWPAVTTGLGFGVGAGLGLYGASEVGSVLGRRIGIDHDEWLRESLAPSRRRDWALLFGVVLPVIAIFEELLFRAVLVGAFSAGFAVSPWVLAVGSSLLFAVGHGIQGTAGIVVTGVVGFVLAGLFVVTESLLAVVTAHYVLNACEFAVHELPDIDSPAG